jgi:hypothetical protein
LNRIYYTHSSVFYAESNRNASTTREHSIGVCGIAPADVSLYATTTATTATDPITTANHHTCDGYTSTCDGYTSTCDGYAGARSL